MSATHRNTPPPDYVFPPGFNKSEPEPEPKLKKGEKCNKTPDNCAKGLVCKRKKFSIRHTCQPERSSKKKGRSRSNLPKSMRVKNRK